MLKIWKWVPEDPPGHYILWVIATDTAQIHVMVNGEFDVMPSASNEAIDFLKPSWERIL